MASRLRYNNQGGTLGATLTNTGTTITFASAPGFATLASGDHIPLILEPPSGSTPSANFEVVWMTAYTAGATTGTIARGQEGTSGVAHSSGASWAHAPTTWDAIFGKGADAPWPGNLGYDYEFLNPGSALPSGWAWTNQGSAVYSEYLKGGSLSVPQSGTSDSWAIVTRAAPTAPFMVTAKLKITHWPATNYVGGALVLLDAANKMFVFGENSGSPGALAHSVWNSPTSWNSTIKTYGDGSSMPTVELYLRIVYTSATSISTYFSADGNTWVQLNLAYNPGSLLGTVTLIGFGGNGNGGPVGVTCEWFRVR